ncbi:MAG: hypothetical protein APR53_08640 [Methanoculleus sp. SDB]|nr:MAG: hypothetical protein APR53_08640 [Methanoculleus sp. SDB]
MGAMPISEENSRIIDILKDNPRGMSVTDIARDLQINRNTVSRYLDMLLISGQAEMKTYGKAKVFFPSQRVPISAMLNFSSDFVVVLDRDFIVVQVNDALCTFTGASREEIIGREVRDSHLAAFDHPLIRAKLREAMGGAEVLEELRILRVGEERFFRFKIIPTVFYDGSPGVTVILEDITDQKQAEETLREREITYRTLVEEINDVILNIDEHGSITFVSPRISDVLGYLPGEMTGSPFSAYMEPGEVPEIISPVPPRSFSCVECTMRAQDGRPVVLEASGRPMYDEIGEFSGYRLVCRDVTERNAAVKRISQWKSFLHSIVQNMPGIVMVRELEGEAFVFCNTAAEKLFRMTATDISGLHAEDLFGPDTGARIREADRQALDTLSPVEIEEIRVKTGDDGDRFLHMRIIPIRNARGRPKYLLIIAGDISDQRHSMALVRAQRDLAITLGSAGCFAEAVSSCLAALLDVPEIDTAVMMADPGSGKEPVFSGTGGITAVQCREITAHCLRAAEHANRPPGIPLPLPVWLEIDREVPGLKAVACIPVIDDGVMTACMIAASKTCEAFPAWSMHALESVATQAGNVIARLRVQESLRLERDRAQGYLDTAGVMVAVIAADGRVERMNRRGCALLGYSENELIGRDWFGMLVPHRIRDRQRAHFTELMAGAAAPPAYSMSPVLARDGSEVTLFWHTTLLKEPDGSITGMVSSADEMAGGDAGTYEAS